MPGAAAGRGVRSQLAARSGAAPGARPGVAGGPARSAGAGRGGAPARRPAGWRPRRGHGGTVVRTRGACACVVRALGVHVPCPLSRLACSSCAVNRSAAAVAVSCPRWCPPLPGAPALDHWPRAPLCPARTTQHAHHSRTEHARPARPPLACENRQLCTSAFTPPGARHDRTVRRPALPQERRVVTAIPGPKSQELQARKQAAVAGGVGVRAARLRHARGRRRRRGRRRQLA